LPDFSVALTNTRKKNREECFVHAPAQFHGEGNEGEKVKKRDVRKKEGFPIF